MVNTGTWNSDLAPLIIGLPLLVFLVRIVMDMVWHNKQLSQNVYQIDVYQEEPKPKRVKLKKPKKQNKSKSAQVSPMTSQAIEVLIGLGIKRSEARRIVSRLYVSKSYKRPEDIIIDAIKCV